MDQDIPRARLLSLNLSEDGDTAVLQLTANGALQQFMLKRGEVYQLITSLPPEYVALAEEARPRRS